MTKLISHTLWRMKNSRKLITAESEVIWKLKHRHLRQFILSLRSRSPRRVVSQHCKSLFFSSREKSRQPLTFPGALMMMGVVCESRPRVNNNKMPIFMGRSVLRPKTPHVHYYSYANKDDANNKFSRVYISATEHHRKPDLRRLICWFYLSIMIAIQPSSSSWAH